MDASISPDLQEALMERINSIAITHTLKMEVLETGQGICAVRIPRQRRYDGIYHSLHGGILTTLADSVAAYAILTLTGAKQPMATTDLNIRFLAPCNTGVTARARVIKQGRTMCPVYLELFDDDGKMVAVAQINYMLFDNDK
jgi:uncharacterized protein (TIGR00369 family)